MQNHKKTLVFPAIEPKFKGGQVPFGFVNDARGWTASRPQVEEAVRQGKLLTLDIDMPGIERGEGKPLGYPPCSLNCAHCFRKELEHKGVSKDLRLLSYRELEKHLQDAKSIGLPSIKIIGPGEPLEDRRILGMLEMLKGLDIIPLVFTKGHIFGDDGRCIRIHGMDASQLAARLKDLGATILLGATSFDAELEDGIVGRPGYHALRDKAFVRLIEAGFADFIPGEASRLGLSFSPVTPRNVDEAFKAYEWARERHIQPIIAPAIIAGRAKAGGNVIVDREALIELYVGMNIHAIGQGIFTLDELKERGISAYGGAAPCSQLSVGIFLRGDGLVLRCPGNDTSILGDVREKSLKEIWEENAWMRRFRNPCNNYCPPKCAGGSYPKGFFEEVLREIERRLGG